MTPTLLGRVAAIRQRWRDAGRIGHETLIINERTGAPYRKFTFRSRFREVRVAASEHHPELCQEERMQPGLPELRFQDLRDTAVTRLALAKCTLPQIAAITGHSPEHITSVIKHYLAVNEALADDAIRLLTIWLDEQGIAL